MAAGDRSAVPGGEVDQKHGVEERRYPSAGKRIAGEPCTNPAQIRARKESRESRGSNYVGGSADRAGSYALLPKNHGFRH